MSEETLDDIVRRLVLHVEYWGSEFFRCECGWKVRDLRNGKVDDVGVFVSDYLNRERPKGTR
jgi:hypothetical protein